MTTITKPKRKPRRRPTRSAAPQPPAQNEQPEQPPEPAQDSGEMTNEQLRGVTSNDLRPKLKHDFNTRIKTIDGEIKQIEQQIKSLEGNLTLLRNERDTVNRMLTALK
jgi:hypothetical protein